MSDPEPKPLASVPSFEEGDFHGLSEELSRDPQYNDRRLLARRKLATLGKEAARRAKAAGTPLECRTSLHNPNAFNGHRVRRLWAYLTRPKAQKQSLKRVLGRELGKDLDSAYKNAYLCLAIEAEALETSLRIHPEGWYDGENLKKRVAAGGLRDWLEHLNALAGFRLRLDDWKGEWRCGELTPEELEEFLGYYTRGSTGSPSSAAGPPRPARGAERSLPRRRGAPGRAGAAPPALSVHGLVGRERPPLLQLTGPRRSEKRAPEVPPAGRPLLSSRLVFGAHDDRFLSSRVPGR